MGGVVLPEKAGNAPQIVEASAEWTQGSRGVQERPFRVNSAAVTVKYSPTAWETRRDCKPSLNPDFGFDKSLILFPYIYQSMLNSIKNDNWIS